jgi:hypothetical protein
VKERRFFVEFTEYAGFGQLTISREFFASWQEMRKFANNLRPNAVLDYGETRPSLAAEKVAA